MGDLVIRRREMVQASGGGSNLLYSLYNYTAAAGTSIDTGVAPFKQGMNCTIVCDITTNANPTTSGAAGSIYKLFRVLNAAEDNVEIAVGKAARGNNYITAYWMGVGSNYGSRTAQAQRKRFVVTHAADSNDVSIYNRLGSAAVGTKNLTQPFIASTNNLFIGSSNTAVTQQLPSSTINKFEVYNRLWTQAEIDAFFA